MQFHLITDVLLLLEVFEKFRDFMFEKYKLDPSQFITTPSITMAAALLKCKKTFDQLTKKDVT